MIVGHILECIQVFLNHPIWLVFPELFIIRHYSFNCFNDKIQFSTISLKGKMLVVSMLFFLKKHISALFFNTKHERYMNDTRCRHLSTFVDVVCGQSWAVFFFEFITCLQHVILYFTYYFVCCS